MGHRCRELLREIAISKEMMIYAGSINRDHVHMLISIPPQLSVSRAVQYLKGKSSHRLLSEYEVLAILGSASMGQGILGSFEWECGRRGVERLHQESEATGA